jgi:hypothetical protein
MKYTGKTVYHAFEDGDGGEYRVSEDGNSVEKLYGMSWEPVFHEEEKKVLEYFKSLKL